MEINSPTDLMKTNIKTRNGVPTFPGNIKRFLVYKDHHKYSNDDMEFIYKEMGKYGCESIITTTKDYYKLLELNKKNVVILKIKMEFDFIDYGPFIASGLSKKHVLTDFLDRVISNVS